MKIKMSKTTSSVIAFIYALVFLTLFGFVIYDISSFMFDETVGRSLNSGFMGRISFLIGLFILGKFILAPIIGADFDYIFNGLIASNWANVKYLKSVGFHKWDKTFDSSSVENLSKKKLLLFKNGLVCYVRDGVLLHIDETDNFTLWIDNLEIPIKFMRTAHLKSFLEKMKEEILPFDDIEDNISDKD